MLELYTEKVCRVIFHARHEARDRIPLPRTEHLLLGIVHNDTALSTRLLGAKASLEFIRKQMEDACLNWP